MEIVGKTVAFVGLFVAVGCATGSVDPAASDEGTVREELAAPKPVVTAVVNDSIWHNAGPTSGPDFNPDINTFRNIKVMGANFVEGATILLDGVECTDVQFGSDDHLYGNPPPGAQGLANVVVRNPDGKQGKLAGGYRYYFDPATLPLAGWYRDFSFPWRGNASNGISATQTFWSYFAAGTPTPGETLDNWRTADFDGTTASAADATSALYYSNTAYSYGLLVKTRTARPSLGGAIVSDPQLIGDQFGSGGLSFTTEGFRAWHVDSKGEKVTPPVPVTANAWHFLWVSYNGNRIRIDLDFGPTVTVAAGSRALRTGAVFMGRGRDEGSNVDVVIAEVIFSQQDLTANKAQLRNYLNGRYALAF